VTVARIPGRRVIYRYIPTVIRLRSPAEVLSERAQVSFCSRMMNETVSGVFAGVVPNTLAPGSAATFTPCATLFIGVAADAAEAPTRRMQTLATIVANLPANLRIIGISHQTAHAAPQRAASYRAEIADAAVAEVRAAAALRA
jgi:hypothetical protein